MVPNWLAGERGTVVEVANCDLRACALNLDPFSKCTTQTSRIGKKKGSLKRIW